MGIVWRVLPEHDWKQALLFITGKGTTMQKLSVNFAGQLTLSDEKRGYIIPSPIGSLVVGGRTYMPVCANVEGDVITVTYSCGSCMIKIEEKEGYHKLTVISVPEKAQIFMFGPYITEATSFGEILGAGWFDDGSVACIQSLMPKVVGGMKAKNVEDTTDWKLTSRNQAAVSVDGVISLQCSVLEQSRDAIIDEENTIRFAVPGPDGKIEGAAIALIGADNAKKLLDTIDGMEVAEGMPHPTYQGNFAKKDKRVSSVYFIVKRISGDELIDIAEQANVTCIYFAEIFASWGHFPINTNLYPQGAAQVHGMADRADKRGIVIGAHSLSNFIHTTDAFVTPVPHKKLLIMNRTTLVKDISCKDTDIYIADSNNYASDITLNAFRIGDEIIQFGKFDPETKCLSGCIRGAFGTTAMAHGKGEEVGRLPAHSYRTFFPNIEMQEEMATNLGNAIVACGIRRLSFDGLEGCLATFAGEYAPAAFVRKVYEITGNDFTCDASRTGHYLWHALSYANWGEPWCDMDGRGGMYADRVNHIPFFKRNLIPLMMGWFVIHPARGRFEATSPETMEYILSRTAAFDAGLALRIDDKVVHGHGLFGKYLDLVRLWGEFRLGADIPEKVLRDMQRENSNWHLEKTQEGWKLSELMLHVNDLEYCERKVETEAGTNDIGGTEQISENLRKHATQLSPDAPFGEGRTEAYKFRIRVGEPGHGRLINPEFEEFGLKFELDAEGGDYLVYDGGMDMYHYDCNFNLKQIVKSRTGRPMILSGHLYHIMTYISDNDEVARYMMTDFRTLYEYDIKPKAEV